VRVVDVAAFVVLAAGLSGVVVRAVGAGWACDGSLVCRLGLDALSDIQAYHRLLAYVAVGLAAWLAVEAFRTQRGLRLVVPLSLLLAGVIGAEALIGLGSVWLGVPDLGQALHAAASTAAWTCAVALLVAVHRPRPAVVVDARGAGTLGAEAVVPRSTLRLVAAYVQLTKPRVMSLLLATTAAAMVIAARGMPPLGLLLATLLGGALMSGGAGAINHYVDRDIDPLMGRTAWRPIPSGVIAPARALAFGIILAVLATAVLLALTNPLATLFALLGLLGYVFIYTLWLKRSTPSNIVIGGAAGALPPLVGWAAVTGEVSSLTAWYLFAIIFFWTPPHFWALSLLIRKHYERAGVPMLPVVRGEDETRRQIVLYSCLLVALSLVLSPFGLMGLVYFASAVVLGGLFIAWALRLWREATPQAARRLYLYSILYLFMLFVAMAVDRSL
jgi:protoheme IX farnesyltransferase